MISPPITQANIVTIQGTIFRRTIRASYASLDLEYHNQEEENDEHVIVVIQCPINQEKVINDGTINQSPADFNPTSWRSNIRRLCKLGNEVEVIGSWGLSQDGTKRFHVIDDIKNNSIKIIQIQKLDMIKCQLIRQKYYPVFACDEKIKLKNRDRSDENNVSLNQKKQRKYEGQTGHGGGLGKRMQGEALAAFLIKLVSIMLEENANSISVGRDDHAFDSEIVKSRFVDFSTIETLSSSIESDEEKQKRAIQFLNRGSGVMDVAGGSGHLSLALALKGIKSTVIDPRESVGKLPGRDRKALRRALKGYQSKSNKQDSKELKSSILPPPIEFSSMRAWFSKRPDGVDIEFREGISPSQVEQSEDKKSSTEIPVCTMCSSDGLLTSCSAIIALHPDEATGEIVDFAIKHNKLFIVVPCCVFSRLFPHRFKPQQKLDDKIDGGRVGQQQNKDIVSTYNDLIEYLVDKDINIRVTKLEFDGANLALWSFGNK